VRALVAVRPAGLHGGARVAALLGAAHVLHRGAGPYPRSLFSSTSAALSYSIVMTEVDSVDSS
jgi:hypothetical protein